MAINYQIPKKIIPKLIWHLKKFTRECVRVLKVTKKPDKAEYIIITKVTGLGMLIIGGIGFIIYLVREIIARFIL